MATSTSIRGAEGTMSLTVGTRRFTLLVKNWRINPNFELKKDAYSGERTPRANPSFDGVDFSFDCDEEDGQVLELRQLLMDTEEAGLAPPEATLQFRYKYRKPGQRARVELLPKCTLAPKGRDNGGQKENISNSFEGYCPTSPRILST